MIRVTALTGGIARESINRKLVAMLAARGNGRFAFDAPDLGALPFFSQDIEDAPPAAVVEFRAKVAGADALLVASPEYNRSYPGVLKNALDWTSRPESLGAGKPAALVGASGGSIGTFGAQQHLRNVLSFLDWRVMSQPEFYFNFPRSTDGRGAPTPETLPFLDDFLAAFEAWVRAHPRS